MARVILTYPIRRSADSVLIANTSPRVEVFRTATYATFGGSSDTALSVAERGGLSTGDAIYVGTNAAVSIAAVSGTGPGTVTLASPLSWSNNDSVVVKRKTGEGTDAYATLRDDPNLTTTISQPITANADNEVRFFAKPGRYGVRWSDSDGNTLDLDHDVTFDDVDWVQVTPSHDSPTAGIQEAITKLSTAGGVVYIPAGTYTISTGISITRNDVTLLGAGKGATVIQSTSASGDAIVVDLSPTNGNDGRCTIEKLEVLQSTNALSSGSALVRVESAANFCLRDIAIRGPSSADLVGNGVALEINQVTQGQIDNIWIQGYNTERWGVGVDIGNAATQNWGNLTFNGGVIERAIVGARIALGASNTINAINFVGTKFVLDGGTARTDGIGLDAYGQAHEVNLIGAHFEAFNNCVRLNGVKEFNFTGCSFGRAETGASPTSVKMVTNAVNNVSFYNCRWSNNISAGTGISLDASAHAGVYVIGARQTNIATFLSDSGTGGNRIFITDVTSLGLTLRDTILHTDSDIRVGGFLNFGDRVTPTTKTLASDAFTADKSYHVVAAETGTSDTCATIAGGGVGDILVLRPDTGDTINFVETGNLTLGAATRTLDSVNDHITLINEDGSNWSELSYADNA